MNKFLILFFSLILISSFIGCDNATLNATRGNESLTDTNSPTDNIKSNNSSEQEDFATDIYTPSDKEFPENSKPEENSNSYAETKPSKSPEPKKDQGNKKKSATIYFADPDAMGLNGEKRQLRNLTPEALINELIKGPQKPGNERTIPRGTRLLGIDVKEQIAYVNFNKDLQTNHWGGSAGEIMTVYSIINTLTLNKELDIREVQILIEDEIVDSLAGHLEISYPSGAYLDILNPNK